MYVLKYVLSFVPLDDMIKYGLGVNKRWRSVMIWKDWYYSTEFLCGKINEKKMRVEETAYKKLCKDQCIFENKWKHSSPAIVESIPLTDATGLRTKNSKNDGHRIMHMCTNGGSYVYVVAKWGLSKYNIETQGREKFLDIGCEHEKGYISPHGIAFVTTDKERHIWDIETGKHLTSMSLAAYGSLNGVSERHFLLQGSKVKKFSLWDINSMREIFTGDEELSEAFHVGNGLFHNNYITSSKPLGTRMWDVRAVHPVRRLWENPIVIELHYNNTLVTSSRVDGVAIYDLRKLNEPILRKEGGEYGAVMCGNRITLKRSLGIYTRIFTSDIRRPEWYSTQINFLEQEIAVCRDMLICVSVNGTIHICKYI